MQQTEFFIFFKGHVLQSSFFSKTKIVKIGL
jgi:hypothetical protein